MIFIKESWKELERGGAHDPLFQWEGGSFPKSFSYFPISAFGAAREAVGFAFPHLPFSHLPSPGGVVGAVGSPGSP